MRKSTSLLIALTAVACSTGGARSDADVRDDDLTTRTSSLSAESAEAVSLRVHPTSSAVAHLEGSFRHRLAPGARPDVAAIAFLEAHRHQLGIDAPALELAHVRTESDDRDNTHVRLRQMHRGVPVLDAEVFAHFDGDGALRAIASTYVPDLAERVDVTPAFAETAARAVVEDAVRRIEPRASEVPVESSELGVWAPPGESARLVYRIGVNVKTPRFVRRVVLVDAHTGRIVLDYDNLQTIEGSGVGALGDTKKIEVSQDGATFLMNDMSRAAPVRTYALNPANQQGEIVTSTDRNSWEANVTTGKGSAVDAHFHAAVVADYYLETHQRSGIDGQSGALLSVTHVNDDPDNAAWNGELMIYGDGQQVFRPLAAALDVVAHEFTHGVTQATSNLRYMGESGALNEAISDIFAAFIEHRLKPGERNWFIAEDVVRVGGSLRNLIHPTEGFGSVKPRAHVSTLWKTDQDNGGVHINSGIPANAAFLMTMGGTNDVSKIAVPKGIGWEKSEKLWYLTNTKYLQVGTDFVGAADATRDAAKALGFSDEEQSIVECAWIAVGVRSGSSCSIAGSPTDPGGANGSGADGDGDGDGTAAGDTLPSRPARGLRAAADEGGCTAAPHRANGAGGAAALLVGAVVGAMAVRRRSPRRSSERARRLQRVNARNAS